MGATPREFESHSSQLLFDRSSNPYILFFSLFKTFGDDCILLQHMYMFASLACVHNLSPFVE